MKFELKKIVHSPSLSEETTAFSANLYIDNKKVGYAKNTGIGGCSEVRIDPEWNDAVEKHSLEWLNALEPNPTDYSKKAKIVDGYPIYERISADQRKTSSAYGHLSDAVDQIVSNYVVLKELKKIKSKVCHTTTTTKTGEYVRYRMKPSELDAKFKEKVESEADFGEWLHTMELQALAIKLGHRDPLDGPLTLCVG